MPTLTDLPCDHLVPHERNVGSGVGDLSDLMASITAVGILRPLLVVPLAAGHPDTGPDAAGSGAGPWYQIIVGHRRHSQPPWFGGRDGRPGAAGPGVRAMSRC